METDEEYQAVIERERAMERILLSNADPVSKVRKLVELGIGEEDADEIVARYQIGQMQPTYYERLEFEEDYPDE